jgi:hypothetical protein
MGNRFGLKKDEPPGKKGNESTANKLSVSTGSLGNYGVLDDLVSQRHLTDFVLMDFGAL